MVAFDGKRLKGTSGNLSLISAWASRAQPSSALIYVGAGAEKQEALRHLLPVS